MIEVNKYPGDEVFQRALKRIGSPMDVWDVKMFVAGILLGPEMIMPSVVIEEVLLKDTEEEIAWEDEKQASEFMSMFLGLWNQIAGYAGSSSRYPKLAKIETRPKSKVEKLKAIARRGSELTWFYNGLDESGGLDCVDSCFELAMLQMPLAAYDKIFIEVEMSDLEGTLSDEDIEEGLEAVNEFEEIWPEVYPNLNRVFLAIRHGEIEMESEEEMEEKFEQLEQMIKNGDL